MELAWSASRRVFVVSLLTVACLPRIVCVRVCGCTGCSYDEFKEVVASWADAKFLAGMRQRMTKVKEEEEASLAETQPLAEAADAALEIVASSPLRFSVISAPRAPTAAASAATPAPAPAPAPSAGPEPPRAEPNTDSRV